MVNRCPGCGVREAELHKPNCPQLPPEMRTDEPKIGSNTGNRGMGRPKGASNKVTREIKEMVVAALDEAGGIDYLVTQSRDNPTAFLTLVGKVLPLQVAGSLDHQVKVSGALAWKPQQ